VAGLSTYPISLQVQSADVGYAIMQGGKQAYYTDAQVVAATSLQDIIDIVNAAVVSPGAESQAQRTSIARALAVGGALGDLSTVRVQAATSIQNLAEQTWVTNDPNYVTHLGVNLLP